MRKSKVHMPKELKHKCHVIIHGATTAAAAAGAIPIPMSDAIPIGAAQISMIIGLGKVFDLTLTDSAAKSIAGVALTQQVGRAVVANILKVVPGVGTIIGGVIGATTAATLTETLGWIVANDFYKISEGEEPENIAENASALSGLFGDCRFSKE